MSSSALSFELQGKRAMVTGAGQGVGAAIARMLALAGASVLVNDYFPERAQAITDAIATAGGSATAVAFDVTDHRAVREAITAQPIDILVNNAGNAGTVGFGLPRPFLDTSPTDWDSYLQVNLLGVMHCVHAALPAMIEQQWGRVVTIVSDAARTGESQLAPYAAAKAGAAGFGRALAHEVARHGITVNSLALGTMRTSATEEFWADEGQTERQKALMRDYLIRRPGEPDDVAWMVATLASPRASWITGQTIPVNGGLSFAQ